MAVTRPCYCSREDVKAASDFALTSRENARVDRAIQSVSELVEGELHRIFYPLDATMKFDWPNYQYTYPWKLYLDFWDLCALTQLQSPSGTNIPLSQVILYPANRRPGWPYTRIELDRSTTAAWGAGPTPQLSIWATGTWGFTVQTDPAGQLAAAVTDTTGTGVTISDGSLLGVGDVMIADSERMIVQEKAAVDSGQTNVAGATSASASDNAITVTSGSALHLGEVLALDSERLLVDDITGNLVTVRRAWDGTVLATHSAGTKLYAYRSLTVLRGQLGTAAATHSNAAPVSRHRPPVLVRDLSVAEAQNRVQQELSAYSRTVGEGDGARPAPGIALADLWDEAVATYGRKGRTRAV